MAILSAEEIAGQLRNVVHLDTQATSNRGLDLTAASIYRIMGSGSLDFGGSEFEKARREKLEPEHAQPDDDYGWWELKAGTYFLRYNETAELDAGRVAVVQPHRRLLAAGAHHPSFQVQGRQDPLETLLEVAERGVRIKENARVSKMLVLDDEKR